MQRASVALFLIASIACKAEVGSEAEDLAEWNPTEDSCWTTCGWSPDLPACFSQPGVMRYARLLIETVRPDVSPTECVCASWRLSPDGTLHSLNIRGTSEEAEEAVRRAFTDSTPLPPVPNDARCIFAELLYSSYGGTGPL